MLQFLQIFLVIIKRKEMNRREKFQDLRPMTKISIAKSMISSLLVTTMYQFDYFVHCLKYIQIIGVVYKKNITCLLIFFFNQNVLNQKQAAILQGNQEKPFLEINDQNIYGGERVVLNTGPFKIKQKWSFGGLGLTPVPTALVLDYCKAYLNLTHAISFCPYCLFRQS